MTKWHWHWDDKWISLLSIKVMWLSRVMSPCHVIQTEDHMMLLSNDSTKSYIQNFLMIEASCWTLCRKRLCTFKNMNWDSQYLKESPGNKNIDCLVIDLQCKFCIISNRDVSNPVSLQNLCKSVVTWKSERNATKNFHLRKHPRESLKSTFITDDRISRVLVLYFTYGYNEFWRVILPHIGSKFHIYFVTSIECSSDSNDSNQWATKSLQRWRIRNQYIATACIATGDIFSMYQCLFFIIHIIFGHLATPKTSEKLT